MMTIWNRLFGGGNEQPPEPPAFPIELVLVRGKDALTSLAELQRTGQQAGFYPVIAGVDDDLSFHNEQRQYVDLTPAEIIERADALDVKPYFEQRRAADPEYYSFPDDGKPGRATRTKIGAHLNVLTRLPLKWVYIAKVPAERNWQIPAHFLYGGWNECPEPPVHVALWREWHQRYEANIVSMTHDVIEAQVGKPPADPDDADRLAREQYMYCPDIVDQGVETLANLSATLLGSDVWYFWWD